MPSILLFLMNNKRKIWEEIFVLNLNPLYRSRFLTMMIQRAVALRSAPSEPVGKRECFGKLGGMSKPLFANICCCRRYQCRRRRHCQKGEKMQLVPTPEGGLELKSICIAVFPAKICFFSAFPFWRLQRALRYPPGVSGGFPSSPFNTSCFFPPPYSNQSAYHAENSTPTLV